jgi:hypothetical protein
MQSEIQRMSRRDPLIFGDEFESDVRDGRGCSLRACRAQQQSDAYY